MLARTDGLWAGYQVLKKAGRITLERSGSGWVASLTGDYRRAFLAGEDLPDL